MRASRQDQDMTRTYFRGELAGEPINTVDGRSSRLRNRSTSRSRLAKNQISET